MVDYTPLHKTLKDRGISFNGLKRMTGIANETRGKFKQNDGEYVELYIIEKVCKALQVPIEKVVYIDYENDDDINSY
jgi:DNA-binding Xre family transcriptional regulator